MVSVAGSAPQWPPWSTLPRIAVRGAMDRKASRMVSLPTSPACRIWSHPARACRASGRKSPCVSEMTPIRMLVVCANADGHAGTRIKLVSQAVADKVERQNRQHDGDGREDDHVGRVE